MALREVHRGFHQEPAGPAAPVVGVHEQPDGNSQEAGVAAAVLLPRSSRVILGCGTCEDDLPDGLVVFNGRPALKLVGVA
ncbi:hypothetical protein GCM10023198_14520 [Promicromonospora umidemergens]|uniref:Uncharacterized protein n=1 Tax=Promicromonospora umidemergens TaxID=629679 RepID=A0ABP8WUC9_9MICO